MNVLEICAGAGGQALGLERAGFEHAALVEIDHDACSTLRRNRDWPVIENDVRNIDGRDYRNIDLLAGGVPCPPFSFAGKQLGPGDKRDLFPEALRLVHEARPAAVMLENVRGIGLPRFAVYRASLCSQLARLGYLVNWRLLNASDYGVPQLRPRFVLVAVRRDRRFRWPLPSRPVMLGEALGDLMAANDWPGAAAWAAGAIGFAPTIVGGSKEHGGPDVGPTRARGAWWDVRIDGSSLADAAPRSNDPEDLIPRLTLRMAARLQGFPDDWEFAGQKTAAYRQIGNAFPPPVAAAVGRSIAASLLVAA